MIERWSVSGVTFGGKRKGLEGYTPNLYSNEGLHQGFQEVEECFPSTHVRSFTTGVEEVMDGVFQRLDHVLTILEVGQRLPCGFMKRIALPLHEILHTGAMVSLIQDSHLILGFTIDDEGRWEMVRTTRRVDIKYDNVF